uniref:Putative secreted protein n=1 Tax=Anopheles darlingi TaxID=43151 RepID=A0A2M4DGW6_ANODA
MIVASAVLLPTTMVVEWPPVAVSVVGTSARSGTTPSLSPSATSSSRLSTRMMPLMSVLFCINRSMLSSSIESGFPSITINVVSCSSSSSSS